VWKGFERQIEMKNVPLSISIVITFVFLAAGSAFAEVEFDGLKWYMSEDPEKLTLNEHGHMVWQNPRGPEQLTVHFPPIDLSDVGDVAEVVYLIKSDGANTGEIGTDPMIISGTGDLRVGLFDSNGGERVKKDGYPYRAKRWCGYLGFCARICPHLQVGIKREHSDAIPGKIMKRKNALIEGSCESLVQSAGAYRGSSKDISGFDLKFGEFSPLILKMERISKETVVFSVTLNNVTYDFVDDNPQAQPQKADTLALYYPNPKNIHSITLAGKYFSRVRSASKVSNPTIQNTIVYGKVGDFCGWPANNGVWIWGNEILVGFSYGRYVEKKGHNKGSGSTNVLARSTDGGVSWTMEDPENFAGDGGVVNLAPGNINFAHPDFAMRMHRSGGARFFISYDRGRKWQGPWGFGDLMSHPQLKGLENTARTDYIVNGKEDCFMFMSARKPDTGTRDRAFVGQTTDGGKTFKFVSWINHEEVGTVRGAMPSTVRISKKKLVSALRRKYPDQWVDVFASNDNGESWKFLSKVADTGGWNGNPPALVKLKDGRICCVYGNRTTRTMNTRYSRNEGKSWGREYILRNDYQTDSLNDPDLGYPRVVERPDGKLVAMYYWATRANLHHHIAATIWDPQQEK
jgi:hypothetical protein